MIWITADSHYNHSEILHYCHRPFATIEEMNNVIIDAANSCVQRNDILFHLGDFGWRASCYGKLRMRLRVRELHVVRGNHDAASLRKHVSSLEYMILATLEKTPFHFCHYPLHSWSAKEHGAIHLHGHSHGRAEWCMNRFDVGVDVAYALFGEYRPFSLKEVIELAKIKFDEQETQKC